MRKKALVGLIVLSFLMALTGLTGCGKNAYFGVRNKAIGVPEDFEQTEGTIEKAERSPGAQYAPEKIAKARELGKKAVDTYWGCRTAEAMAMLAEARRLAGEAELAKAPPKPAPIVAKPAPPKLAPAPAKPAPPKPAPAPAKVAPPPPKAKPVAVAPKEKRIIIFQKPGFGFDSTELTPEARAILDEQVAVLETDQKLKLVITGHTDSIGPEEYNQGLSERRANAVQEYLVSKGVSPGRLKTVGYGETRPIATNATREGQAQNRRIELIPVWK
jgi:outer membrane protein OmpA-like peptidoglycan-associated protein